jgi:hypothetical protein
VLETVSHHGDEPRAAGWDGVFAELAQRAFLRLTSTAPWMASMTRFRMDLETARAALTRANQRHQDLQDRHLSREQPATFIGSHEVNVMVAEINALGQAIARTRVSWPS